MFEVERLDTGVKTVAAMGGAIASYFYGGWSNLLEILLAFVVIDYVTGIMASGIEGKLSSLVGIKGIARKVFIFVMVAVAHLVDTSIGDGSLFRDATVFFYLANELISILENAGRVGLPVPDILKQALEVLKGRSDTK